MFDLRSVVVIMVLLHARKGGSGGGSKEEEEVVLQGREKGMRLGKYELGRTLGEGNFGKVKYARNLESGQPFAIKILEKNRILDLKITDQVLNLFSFLFFAPCFSLINSVLLLSHHLLG